MSADRMAVRVAPDHREALSFLQELIRIPSPTGREAAVAEYVERYARAAGLRDVTRDEHGNVLITLRGRRPGRTTLFLTHLDHAGAGKMSDPHRPAVLDGASFGKSGTVVRGLGACAPKSAVAAMLAAAVAASRAGLPERGAILVAAVTKDMQANHQGPRELLGASPLTVDRVVAGEPSGNRIVIGARGINQVRITITGTPAHWGRPSEGANPLYGLADALEAIGELSLPIDPVLGPATISPFEVASEAAPPRTPSRVTIMVDRRTLPGEPTTAVVDAIRVAVERAISGRKGLAASVELARAMHSWRTPEDSELVRELRQVAKAQLGLDLETTYITFASNAGYAIAERGWQGVALGPGNIGDVGDNEHVETSSLERATDLYTAFMAGA